MARKIYCLDCGVIKPTPPEDAAKGLFQRYRRGSALRSMFCDLCGTELDIGSDCVAWSQPDTIGAWEHEYIAQSKDTP